MERIIDRLGRWGPIAPLLTVGFVAGAVASDQGDLRKGLFPWLLAATAASMALIPVGVLAVHPDRSKTLTVAGLWATWGFLGPAIGLGAIAVGSALGIPEEDAGILAFIPVATVGSGVISMTPAAWLLAWSVRNSEALRPHSKAILWAVGPIIPLMMIGAGIAEGPWESRIFVGSLVLLVAGWSAVAASTRRAASTVVSPVG